jgi:hypothetical protein
LDAAFIAPMKKVNLRYSIHLVDGIAATSLRIHTTAVDAQTLESSRLATDRNALEGELSVEFARNNLSIYLTVVGDPFKSGSFNMSIGDSPIFKEDIAFTTKHNGRIAVTMHNITLPL